MLICSSDFERLIENWQMVRNPAILREPSGEEEIINLVNSKSVCSQEVVTDLLPETRSLLNVPNGDLVAVKINGSNVQTNGQGIKESKGDVALTYGFKKGILYSTRRGCPRKECIPNFIDSTRVQCCPDPITGIVNLELKAGLKILKAADNLEHSIKKFWEIENVEIDSVKTSELDICEDHFKNTHSRDDQGRYTVAMPLKEDPSCLGESRQTAIQRLNSLLK
ncbi:uncharacterized protein TNCV_946351 [Trichonephila clavipes]|nr:uncharacterized protein TNCV_946351 [Trichonephila clavipes]